jgi:hypothetical protein
MPLLADALQPLFAPGLLAVPGPLAASFDDLMGRRGGFIPTFDAKAKAWSLDFGAADEVAGALAADCSRFACAGFQSFWDVPEELGNSETLPWGLIKAYYSAFYAGHALLRVFGATCTQFDGARVALLRRVLPLYGVLEVPAGGLYVGHVERNGTVVTYKQLGASGGGTHEMFWGVFGETLNSVRRDVLNAGALPTTEAQQVFLTLSELDSLMCRGSLKFNWLSSIRNDVQYRHNRSSWFPERASHRERTALSGLARRWTGDPAAIPLNAPGAADLGTFVAGATFIVGLCRILLDRLHERSTARRSFVTFGPSAHAARRRAP